MSSLHRLLALTALGWLAACSEDPTVPLDQLNTAGGLVTNPERWHVVEPRGLVLPPHTHRLLVDMIRRPGQPRNREQALWVRDEPLPVEGWEPRPGISATREDVAFWSTRLSTPIALTNVRLQHPDREWQRGQGLPRSYSSGEYGYINGQVLIALPAQERPTEGFTATYAIQHRRFISPMLDFGKKPNEPPELRLVRLGDETRPAVMLPPPMKIRGRFTVPDGGRLRFGFGVDTRAVRLAENALAVTETETDGAGVRVAVHAGGARHELVDRFVPRGEIGSYHDIEADLSAWSGQEIVLEIATHGAADGSTDAKSALHDFAYLSNPALADPRSAATGPNVLIVLVDSLRSDALGCYGSKNPTPTFDAVAGRGVRYHNARAPSSATLPSHASLFVSAPPMSHGAWNASHPLPLAFTTIAEVVRAAGWHTFAISDGGLVTPSFGLGQGFDRFHVAGNGVIANTARALEWIDRANTPFFGFVHTNEVHDPYDPPDAWRQRLVAPYDGGLPRAVHGAALRAHQNTRGEATLSRRDIDYVRSLYLAEVAHTDQVLGEFLGALEERGVLDNTLLILTSDHGEEFGEHDGFFHGETLYEEVLRVPLILAHPRAFAGGRSVRTPVNLEDIAPTITDFLGLPTPAEWHGRKLDDLTTPRDIVAGVRKGEHPESPAETNAFALMRGGKKLIRASPGFYDRDPDRSDELFDLQADPGERRPLKPDAMFAEMSRSLAELLATFTARPEPADASEADDGAGMSDQEREQPPPRGQVK